MNDVPPPQPFGEQPTPPPPAPFGQPVPPQQPPASEAFPPPPPPPTGPPLAPQVGTYYSNQQGYNVSGPKPDPFAITSMVLGIISVLVTCCEPLAILLSIVAIVFGGLSLSRIKKNHGQLSGRGMAIAGLVLGICVLIAASALLIWALIFRAGHVGTADFGA